MPSIENNFLRRPLLEGTTVATDSGVEVGIGLTGILGEGDGAYKGQASGMEQDSSLPVGDTDRDRGAQETVAQWKRDFYRAYEQKQYEQAEAIYRSRLPFDFDTPDVHAAYWQHRRIDKFLYLFTGGLAVAALLLTWLLQ